MMATIAALLRRRRFTNDGTLVKLHLCLKYSLPKLFAALVFLVLTICGLEKQGKTANIEE